jgi:molybdenum cofactor cytidylyltransferase
MVLAAGDSRRFGADDKLLAPYDGRPLAAWAAEAMRGAPVAIRIAVVRSDAVAALFADFVIVRAPQEAQQSDSLKSGLAVAQQRGAERLIITLADMPGVDAGLIRQVAETCPSGGASAADGIRRTPPACFDRALFGRLEELGGDTGAGRLLSALPESSLVHTRHERLADIDTRADLDLTVPPPRSC